MIPKRIYYIWLGEGEKPASVMANIATWRKYNPSYDIVEINEDSYDLDSHPFVKMAYQNRQWAFASDVIRLDVIWRYGGIYMDTDVEIIRPLDSLITHHAFWGMENSDSVNSGSLFGAEAGYVTLQRLLDLYAKMDFKLNQLPKMITVPIVTKILVEQGLVHKNQEQRLNDGAVVYPTQAFAPLHYWGGGRVSNDTYSVHHYDASWLASGSLTSKIKLRCWLIYWAPQAFKTVNSWRKRIKH